NGVSASKLMDSALPTPKFFGVIGVNERKHGGGMPNFNEPFSRLSSHPLRRGVAGDEFRTGGFEPLKFLHQQVELGIRNLRIVEHIILVLMMANLLPQFYD